MRVSVIASFLGLSFAAVIAHADGASSLRPGLWETQSSMEMEGMGVRPMPPTTRCITPAEAKDPASAHKPPEGCEMLDVKRSGNTVHWSVSCHLHGGTQTGTGELVYTADTMKITTTVVMNDPRLGQRKMIHHADVHRVGDCPQ
jgi:hypothetical protein